MAGSAVREIRLALVCYGGVSLAVYMFGVTREIQELLLASGFLDAGEDENEENVPPGTTRAAYVEALRGSAKERGGPIPRVVVDIISGTSAGGIDGLFLAKAIATSAPLEPLRKLWIDQADIKTLLAGIGGAVLRLLEFVGTIFRPGSAPLGGPHMVGLVSQSLQAMDSAKAVCDKSLIPQGQSLDLYVPITDGAGHNRFLTLTPGGMTIPDVSHRHVMHFHAGYAKGAREQFRDKGNPALAFAARTTSSFPGAFPPVTIEEFGREFDAFASKDQDRPAGKAPTLFNTNAFVETFFKDYTAWGDNPRNTWFMDGGVLDNMPFDHAVKAIERKTAGTEVERHLVYIEPDPMPPLPSGKAHLPNWPEELIDAGRIPLHQSILDGLAGLRYRNARIEEISNLTSANGLKPRIRKNLSPCVLRPTTSYGEVCAIENAMAAKAAAELGNSLREYLQLRLEAVAGHLGNIVINAFGYSKESGAAVFIRQVIRAWALKNGNDLDYSADGLKSFFEDYDVPYRERRLLFLIQRLNDMYGADNRDRALIDKAKTMVYNALEALDAVPDMQNVEAKGKRIFGPKVLKKLEGLDPGEFATRKRGDLGSFLECLKHPQTTEEPFWIDFTRLLKDWLNREDDLNDLLVGFAGYPLWDAVIFPILALSNIRQAKQIQVNRISPKPEDGTISTEGQKLKGAGLMNFAGFLHKNSRENDYLLGRLDAAAILLRLIHPGISPTKIGEALHAAVNEGNGLGILRKKSHGCVTLKSLDKSIGDLVTKMQNNNAIRALAGSGEREHAAPQAVASGDYVPD